MIVSPRQRAFRLVALQVAVAIIIALFWLAAGGTAMLAAILGGLAAVLPNVYFTMRFFSQTEARKADRIIRNFYWGELTKLLLSALIVIALFKWWPGMPPLPFFSGFICASLGFWFAPLVY